MKKVLLVVLVSLFISSPLVYAALIKTPTFEVKLGDSYTFIDPFMRELPITAEVKNIGDKPDRISFNHLDSPGSPPGGFIDLYPGKTGKLKVGMIIWGMRDREKSLKLGISSSTYPNSKAEKKVKIEYVANPLPKYPAATINIKVLDKFTKKPIKEAEIYNYVSSGSRVDSTSGSEGIFQIFARDSDQIKKFAGKNNYSWSGYHIELHAPGYKSYYEKNLLPKKDQPLEKIIYLEHLNKTGAYDSVWKIKLDYPGVWRVVASKDWKYLAAAMGKHHDLGDKRGATKVHFFDRQCLLWSYPVSDQVWGIDITKDGSLLGVGTQGSLSVLDKKGKLVWKYSDKSDFEEVRFSQTGKYLSTKLNPIKIFDSLTGKVVWEFSSPQVAPWRGITFSPDDKYALFGGGNYLLLLDLVNRKLLWDRYIASLPYKIMLAPNLSRIVVADKGDTLSCYDKKGKLLWRHQDLQVLTDAAMSEDGSLIVALSHDGTIRTYDQFGKQLWRRGINTGGHNAIDITKDGKYISVGGSPFSIHLLDNRGNTLWQHKSSKQRLSAHPYQISTMSVVVGDDASYIASGYGTKSPGVELFKGKVTTKKFQKGLLRNIVENKTIDKHNLTKKKLPVQKPKKVSLFIVFVNFIHRLF